MRFKVTGYVLRKHAFTGTVEADDQEEAEELVLQEQEEGCEDWDETDVDEVWEFNLKSCEPEEG